MNFYETMYIVHPILEMGRLHDLIIETEKIIKEKGGEILFTNVMGKKRMAYPIQKQKFGTYVLVQYKSDGSKNNEFSLDLEHNPNVLRNMIINIEESEVKEQTEDIKDHESESVLSEKDDHVDGVAGSDTINESKSVEENPVEETVLESNQEKANESNTISEKE